jgi:hypothetical protein
MDESMHWHMAVRMAWCCVAHGMFMDPPPCTGRHAFVCAQLNMPCIACCMSAGGPPFIGIKLRIALCMQSSFCRMICITAFDGRASIMLLLLLLLLFEVPQLKCQQVSRVRLRSQCGGRHRCRRLRTHTRVQCRFGRHECATICACSRQIRVRAIVDHRQHGRERQFCWGRGKLCDEWLGTRAERAATRTIGHVGKLSAARSKTTAVRSKTTAAARSKTTAAARSKTTTAARELCALHKFK